MLTSNRAPIAVLLALLTGLCGLESGDARAAVTDYVSVERVASGLARPIFATAPATDLQRLFIVEQHTGRIRILDLVSGTLNAVPFLTVPNLSTGNEQGLLGLAFHPQYAANGFFYVNFTDSSGATKVVRYQVSAGDPDLADAASGTPLLSIPQPQSNHNGGWMGFGPDGFLYIASGDGGGSNDSATGHTPGTGNAQDLTGNLLGKMLRIDVNGDDFPVDPQRNYAIPASNPFVGAAGDDEIWAYGLRNPWRSGFDRLTGDLYIADVGQGSREEIDFQPAGSGGGENYGWRLREGSIATPSGGVGGPAPPGAVDPVYDYTHGGGPTQGNSVTGGYVYRGPILPLRGKYFFADFISRRIWSIQHDGAAVTEFIDWTSALVPDVGSIGNVSSFGEDAAGNLYIVDHGGEVFRMSPVCTLELTLSHDAGGLTMDFVLGSEIPTTWNTWLLAGGAAPLWSIPLSALDEVAFPLNFPGFTPVGVIGVLSLLSTNDGAICADLGFVNTGAAR